MNKYADLSKRQKRENKSIFPNISESRLSALKTDEIQLRSRSPNIFELEKINSDFWKNEVPVSDRATVRKSGISSFSSLRNMCLMGSSGQIQMEDDSVKFPIVSEKLATSKDYLKLIEKLDEVILPKGLSKILTIYEGITSELSILSEKIDCFKILSKGKRCPLSIKIKVFQGSIQSLILLNEPKGLKSGDFKNKKSNFHEVYDNIKEFRNEFIYICIRGVSHSIFKIFTEFGKNKILSDDKKFERIFTNNFLSDSFDDTVVPAKTSEKNFIKINMNLNIQKTNDFFNKGENWKTKKKLVDQKRKKKDKDKKKKIADVLNKRIKRLEVEATEQENYMNYLRISRLCQEWIKIIYTVKSLLSIKALIDRKRSECLNKIKTSQKVYLIQYYYKVYLKPKSNPKVLANRSLLLYRNLCVFMGKIEVNKAVVSYINNSAKAIFLMFKFKGFYESVLLIQREYRRHVKKKHFRLATLRIQWNKCCDKSIYKKKSFSVRKKESLRTISLPNSLRNQILYKFYYERWKSFREEIREYGKALLENDKGIRLPVFKYIPNDIVMEGMIRNAFKQKEAN